MTKILYATEEGGYWHTGTIPLPISEIKQQCLESSSDCSLVEMWGTTFHAVWLPDESQWHVGLPEFMPHPDSSADFGKIYDKIKNRKVKGVLVE